MRVINGADRGTLGNAGPTIEEVESRSESRVSVAIVPGLVGLTGSEDRASTPDSVYELVAELEALGAEVTLQDPAASLVALRGGDLWLPILAFSADVSANAIGSLVADAIVGMLRKRGRSAQDHTVVKLRIERLDPGQTTVIDIEAPVADVVRVLRELE